jgi:L-lactate dehydrogenase (cytochrome)
MTILHELHLRRPDLLRKHEVYIDGGVTRGTDVLKALCLGAKGVGLGRAFLYANGVWGEEGCRRVVQSGFQVSLWSTDSEIITVMREEIKTGMQLLGVTRIEQLTPELVRYVRD